MTMPTMSFIDALILNVDKGLRTLFPPQRRIPLRPSPADSIADKPLSPEEQRHVAGLMRVNHAGEVSAQALYQGQALTARLKHIQEKMQQAALEETDHLAWCEQRLQELGSKPSILNGFWYTCSFIIGAVAGLAGDTISLGFVAETEHQVSQHLQKHVQALPLHDEKTRAILKQMEADESHHAAVAIQAGAIELPFIIQHVMAWGSKLMTTSSYYG